MLDGVAAEADPAVNGFVEEVAEGRQAEPKRHPSEVSHPGQVAREQQADHRRQQDRQDLDEVVEAQIAGHAPRGHGERAEHQQQRQGHGDAGAQVDAVADEGGEQRHEHHGHGQAVPEQRLRRRAGVVIAGAEGDQHHAEEEGQKGPMFARAPERPGRDPPAGQAPQAPKANHQERAVGGDNAKAVDAEHRRRREAVIGLVLVDRRREQPQSHNERRRPRQNPNPRRKRQCAQRGDEGGPGAGKGLGHDCLPGRPRRGGGGGGGGRSSRAAEYSGKMVPPVRIELTASPLPRARSTPELRRRNRGEFGRNMPPAPIHGKTPLGRSRGRSQGWSRGRCPP